MSVYCITSPRSVGCTFFDWTIHFLSGQNQFYRIRDRKWIPLANDPFQEINAHGHLKNHPNGFANIQKFIHHVLSEPQHHLYSMYPTPSLMFNAATDLNISIDAIGDLQHQQTINHYRENEFNQTFAFCHQHNVKLIYVGDHPSVQLYYLINRSNLPKITTGQLANTVEEIKQEHQQVFFNDSINTWNQQMLVDIWDQREQQALNTRPFHFRTQKINGTTCPHLWINCQELWYNGEQAASKMLKYLELELVPDRLTAWRPIYAKWQKKQLQLLEFNFNCQHIVDSIVNNWYYEIDLTFDQEVVIQHCLMYQHNLNLKTWQLTKFPNNTQDLHKLLAPNTHPLTSY